MFIPRAPSDTAFTGICPFHGDCLEGSLPGRLIAARWGQDAQTLPDDHQPGTGRGYLAKAAATCSASFPRSA
jgi:fructokinase